MQEDITTRRVDMYESCTNAHRRVPSISYDFYVNLEG